MKTEKVRLKQKTDIIQFLKKIQSCASDVWFLTKEGDRLNLKSTLSKYLFASISSQDEMLENGQIECRYERDYQVLAQFLE